MFHSLFDWLEYYNNIFNSLFLRIFFILWRVCSGLMPLRAAFIPI
ncbi:hypothetical protein HPHPH36_0048 [Helicobacter pylori Hp H-36]|nr:hypothetical protein HPHPH36_0048 [Helicobacter pylori Hp H-36]